jgi:23S rRNA (uridine2552-2'-O)-methyltransferase
MSKTNKWQDHYSRRAKKDRYPARSVYKLEEIQKKYKLLRKDDKILDLGCSPGSWLLYAANLVGSGGLVVGIDLKPAAIELPAHAKTVVADVFTLNATNPELMGIDFDVVLSDMAPSTTGNKMVDAARSAALCEAALSIAESVLRPGGSFVCKIFQGQDFSQFSDLIRKKFTNQHILKPRSSRKASKEIFVIGRGFIAPELEEWNDGVMK